MKSSTPFVLPERNNPTFRKANPEFNNDRALDKSSAYPIMRKLNDSIIRFNALDMLQSYNILY